MVQIIEENRQPSFLQSIMGGIADNAGPAFEKYQQQKQMQSQNESANRFGKQKFGLDLGGLDPKMRDQLLMEAYKQEGAQSLQQNKFQQDAQALQGKTDKENQEKLGPLQGALDSLNRMTRIRKKGNLGFGSHAKSLYGGDTAKDRGEYEQLGKSLISHATNIPIRNRIEFETLAERLYDSTVTDAEAEGILNSMKSIIQNSMSAYGGNPQKSQGSVGSTKRPISSFSVGK